VTADAKGKLMDVATISRELGVSRSVAEKIARQLPKVKLPDIAKVYVKRADVDRYLVYYRRGGRLYPEEYAGSFKTKREAQTRRDLVAGELAAGRNPQDVLAALRTPAPAKPGLADSWDTWARSKRKVGESAQKLYGNSKAWWVEVLGAATDPATVTVAAITLGLDDMLAELAPATVRLYLSHLAMMLDFTLDDGTPNPARSKKIELPSGERGKVRPFGTHAFRHRRISLWLRQGIDGVQVARWAGHSKPSESTDTYGHTVVDALADEWLGFWQAAYGPRGAAPVRHEEVAE
jgi:hypothetical protein